MPLNETTDIRQLEEGDGITVRGQEVEVVDTGTIVRGSGLYAVEIDPEISGGERYIVRDETPTGVDNILTDGESGWGQPVTVRA